MCSKAESVQAEVREIFESIQGEGILIGIRQLFVRFARCNLSCVYCDTPTGVAENCINHVTGETVRNPVSGEYVASFFNAKVHSICFTGGEPLLYADFIAELPEIRPFYLETNMSLPEEAKKLRHVDFVAGDFKVREALLVEESYEELFENTVKCFRVLKNKRNRLTFCKFVLPEKFDSGEVINSAESIKDYVCCFVLQPVFGVGRLDAVIKLQKELVDIRDTRIIPQVHKYLGVL